MVVLPEELAVLPSDAADDAESAAAVVVCSAVSVLAACSVLSCDAAEDSEEELPVLDPHAPNTIVAASAAAVSVSNLFFIFSS